MDCSKHCRFVGSCPIHCGLPACPAWSFRNCSTTGWHASYFLQKISCLFSVQRNLSIYQDSPLFLLWLPVCAVLSAWCCRSSSPAFVCGLCMHCVCFPLSARNVL